MNLGNLKVLIGADIDPLLKNLKKAERALEATSRNFQNIGDSMMKLSAPLIGVGIATVKMAMEFESSMNKINALVGISKEELKKMTPELKRMAAQYGISSQKAADALYFITSAGLKGADAMNVLEASLKASAVGLGEVSVIADLATSAVNAYGAGVVSGTVATDILAATVREGKLEAASLASTMGQVIPIASAMGVSFDEVGAAYAAMSRTGTNASAATTQLRGILSTLLKPSEAGAKLLDSMGISAESLRAKIKEDGLLSVLQLLKEKFEGNDTALATVFGSVEALNGVMNMMGAGAEITAEIFDKLKASTGDLDTAWAGMSEDSAVRMNKLFVSFQNVGLEVGEKLLPAFEKLLEKLQGLVEWLGTLDAATIANAVEIALWVGGIGVAIKGIGLLIGGIAGAIKTYRAYKGIVDDVKKAQAALNIIMAANPVGLIIAAVAILIALIVVIIKKYETWGAAVALLFGPIGFLINLIQSFARHWDSIVEAFKSDGIVAGLKRIGLVILDALLYPIQQLLQLASKIPGIGDLAGKAAAKIEGLRNKLNLITPSKAAPTKKGQGFYDFMQSGFNAGSSGSAAGSLAGSGGSAPGADGGGSGGGGSSGATGPASQLVSGLSGGNEMTSWVNDATKQLTALEQIKGRLADTSALKKGMVSAFEAIIPAVKEVGTEIEYSLSDKLEMLGDKIKNLADKFLEMVDKIAPLVSQLQDTFGALFDYQSAKIEDNYNKQKAAIEGGTADEESKAAAMLALDEKTNKERRKLARKEAIANKAFAIYNAAINIAVGVTKALSAGPILGPILAAVVAGLGAVQIGMIAAKPLPALAEGGLAFGETQAIVGDNPNARIDPEVIAPLSKLKSMIGSAGNNILVNLEGHFKLNGQDLMLVVQKAEANQLRSRGYNG